MEDEAIKGIREAARRLVGRGTRAGNETIAGPLRQSDDYWIREAARRLLGGIRVAISRISTLLAV